VTELLYVDTVAVVLRAIRSRASSTMYDLMTATGLGYEQVRSALTTLERRGTVTSKWVQPTFGMPPRPEYRLAGADEHTRRLIDGEARP